VGSFTCLSPPAPLLTLWQQILPDDFAALMFQRCQFPE